jgi:hypothetical protein
MWGFANKLNRQLSLNLFKIITNKFISSYYNKYKNKKGFDQLLLTEFFSKYSIQNSTTHDSFFCFKYNDGAQPWPTKRIGKCFVGGHHKNCIEKENFDYLCPVRCRPDDFLDWKFC